MSRAYRFLAVNRLDEMPNPFKLPVYLVREPGGQWERQPAMSVTDAASKFCQYANVKPGKTVEVISPGQDPATDAPFVYENIPLPRAA